jgi:hypothetical protein
MKSTNPSSSTAVEFPAPKRADSSGFELLLKRPFLPDGGVGWTAPLPFEMEVDSDATDRPIHSSWTLVEDGRAIGVPHSLHEKIRSEGRGMFSHWISTLYFSTSDNSNPNLNGRTYSLVWEGKQPKNWLERLNAELSKASTSFSVASSVPKCAGVVAIYGSSYCGSTLLNVLLNAHPKIFGGGELHWLETNPEQAFCSICREVCEFWKDERHKTFTRQGLYDRVARLAGRPVVADASKMSDWFPEMKRENPALDFYSVLMVKHPVRHVASYVEKARSEKHLESFGDINFTLDFLKNYYDSVFANGSVDLILRYEDFVSDTQKWTSRILKHFGLNWHDNLSNWQNCEHHHIGGNVGPRAQIANHRPLSSIARSKYLERGIFLDNSYSQILTLNEIRQIFEHPAGRYIMRKFGYSRSKNKERQSRAS